jgi:hypothetical protein
LAFRPLSVKQRDLVVSCCVGFSLSILNVDFESLLKVSVLGIHQQPYAYISNGIALKGYKSNASVVLQRMRYAKHRLRLDLVEGYIELFKQDRSQ